MGPDFSVIDEAQYLKKADSDLVLGYLKARASGRECGECQACCTTMAVDEIDKPAGEACQHLCESGCGVYETRPASCAGFECGWLQGWGPNDWRPDESGIIVESYIKGGPIGDIVIVSETGPDILEKHEPFLVKWFVQRGYAEAVVCRRYDGTRTLVSSEEMLPIVADRMRAVLAKPKKKKRTRLKTRGYGKTKPQPKKKKTRKKRRK